MAPRAVLVSIKHQACIKRVFAMLQATLLCVLLAHVGWWANIASNISKCACDSKHLAGEVGQA